MSPTRKRLRSDHFAFRIHNRLVVRPNLLLFNRLLNLSAQHLLPKHLRTHMVVVIRHPLGIIVLNRSQRHVRTVEHYGHVAVTACNFINSDLYERRVRNISFFHNKSRHILNQTFLIKMRNRHQKSKQIARDSSVNTAFRHKLAEFIGNAF